MKFREITLASVSDATVNRHGTPCRFGWTASSQSFDKDSNQIVDQKGEIWYTEEESIFDKIVPGVVIRIEEAS